MRFVRYGMEVGQATIADGLFVPFLCKFHNPKIYPLHYTVTVTSHDIVIIVESLKSQSSLFHQTKNRVQLPTYEYFLKRVINGAELGPDIVIKAVTTGYIAN